MTCESPARSRTRWPCFSLAWVEAVELSSSCDVYHARLVFAGGEVTCVLVVRGQAEPERLNGWLN